MMQHVLNSLTHHQALAPTSQITEKALAQILKSKQMLKLEAMEQLRAINARPKQLFPTALLVAAPLQKQKRLAVTTLVTPLLENQFLTLGLFYSLHIPIEHVHACHNNDVPFLKEWDIKLLLPAIKFFAVFTAH